MTRCRQLIGEPNHGCAGLGSPTMGCGDWEAQPWGVGGWRAQRRLLIRHRLPSASSSRPTTLFAAVVLTGAVKAIWTETCSAKGCDVVADKSAYTTPTLWLNSSDFKDDVPTSNKTHRRLSKTSAQDPCTTKTSMGERGGARD